MVNLGETGTRLAGTGFGLAVFGAGLNVVKKVTKKRKKKKAKKKAKK